jgi:hypothetical protein
MGRVIIMSVGAVVGVTMLVAVFLQQKRLDTLTAERAQVLARLAAPVEMPMAVASTQMQRLEPSPASPSLELLKLRAEVARLGNRKRELAKARTENNRLGVQLAARGTNPPGAITLLAGYLRKSQARNVGYDTPEATMETMLWAIQNRDSAGFLQVFDPDTAKQLEPKMQSLSSSEEFFKEADFLPGMRIVGKEAGTDGEVVLVVETMPGIEKHARLRFKQSEGQWKLIGGL